jgi:hypothetical protein
VGIIVGLAPVAVSAQQPSYPDPVPLYRPAADGVMPVGAPAGGMLMAPGYGQAPVPGQAPPGAPVMEPGMLPPPRPLGPGGPAPFQPVAPMPPADAGDQPTSRWILGADFVMLMRNRMKHEALAIADLIKVEAPDPVPPGLNGFPLFADFHDMNQNMIYGVKVGGAYLFDQNNSVEWYTMWMPLHTDKAVYTLPGQLTSFFSGPETVPLGFEGDNGLWDHADQITVNLSTTMVQTELNYHGYGGFNDLEFDWLLGVRYLAIHEKLAMTTDDDGIQFGPDPLFTATYTVRARNNIVAPQLGFGLHKSVFGLNWWSLSWDVKGAWGQNFASYSVELQRGDGFQAPFTGLKKEHFAQIYETSVSTDWSGNCWRVRLGYNVMVIHGVCTGQNQIDFNLDNRAGAGLFDGTLIYTGPFASLQFIF